MTPKEIQEHIDNKTLLERLMRDVEIDSKQAADGKTQLEIRFPEWYKTHISDESKDMIEALIRKNALRAVFD